MPNRRSSARGRYAGSAILAVSSSYTASAVAGPSRSVTPKISARDCSSQSRLGVPRNRYQCSQNVRHASRGPTWTRPSRSGTPSRCGGTPWLYSILVR